MSKKLWYLTKISLNKKIKTKWFLIANLIFLILIVGLINIDSIIELFGGDFNKTNNIYILDNTDYNLSNSLINSLNNYTDNQIEEINNEENAYEIIQNEEDNNILITLEKDNSNYLKAKITSKEEIDNTLYQIIITSLDEIKRDYALSYYGIDSSTMESINKSIEIEREILESKSSEEDIEFIMGVFFPILLLPVFMLTMFLIQMIGAEINEEKSTRGMEIIISNVSAKTHFLSKLISGNCFVLLQGILLIAYVIFALLVRFTFTGAIDFNAILGSSGMDVMNTINSTSFTKSLTHVIPFTIILIILSFIGYSLLSAITASMTTNMEDYQQVQTPIVLISLIGYYLAIMASTFKGSILIRICSYIPFVSTMLSPALLMLGQIGIIDVIISIVIMLITIYLLIKYGLRIYKVGILNYSSDHIWKRMFKAVKNK